MRVLQTTSPMKSYNHISLTQLLILSHSNLYICPHIFKNFATFRKLEFPWRSFLDPSPNEHLLRNRNIFREQLKYYLLFAHDNVVNGLNPGVSVVCLVWFPVWVRVVFRKTVVGDWRFDYLSSSHLQSEVKSVCQMWFWLVSNMLWCDFVSF